MFANIVKGDLGTWEVIIVMSEHIRVKSLISTYSVKNINDDKFKEAVKYTLECAKCDRFFNMVKNHKRQERKKQYDKPFSVAENHKRYVFTNTHKKVSLLLQVF